MYPHPMAASYGSQGSQAPGAEDSALIAQGLAMGLGMGVSQQLNSILMSPRPGMSPHPGKAATLMGDGSRLASFKSQYRDCHFATL